MRRRVILPRLKYLALKEAKTLSTADLNLRDGVDGSRREEEGKTRQGKARQGGSEIETRGMDLGWKRERKKKV